MARAGVEVEVCRSARGLQACFEGVDSIVGFPLVVGREVSDVGCSGIIRVCLRLFAPAVEQDDCCYFRAQAGKPSGERGTHREANRACFVAGDLWERQQVIQRGLFSLNCVLRVQRVYECFGIVDCGGGALPVQVGS